MRISQNPIWAMRRTIFNRSSGWVDGIGWRNASGAGTE
jgi:hypothetical protein